MAPKRKQKRKDVRGWPEGGGEEAASKCVWMKYVLGFGAVATAGVAAYLSALQVVGDLTQTAQNVEPIHFAPAVEVTEPPIKKVPTYDEYVQQAEANELWPIDPIQKLKSIILKYKEFKTVEDRPLIAVADQELLDILEVLVAATDRTIDLTSALHQAIDIIPDVAIDVIEGFLTVGQSNQTGLVQTAGIRYHARNPLIELQKLIAANHAHITVDVNKSGARDAVLVKIVKHRIYPLLAGFAHLGPSVDTVMEALRVAVINADDLALNVILSTAPPPHLLQQKSFVKKIREVGARFPELLALAQKLGYKYIAERIDSEIKLFAGITLPTPMMKAFGEYFPYRRLSTMTSKPPSVRVGARDPLTGFSPFQLEPVHTVASNGFDSHINECAMDRVDIANLTVEHFYAEYVTLRRPVVITRSEGDSSWKDAVNSWTAYNIIKQFGLEVQGSSTLPHVLVNGHTQTNVSLHEFIADPDTGMQAYTQRLQQAVATHGTALSGQQLAEVAASVGLPQYIITGLHQRTSTELHKHILKTVYKYSSSSPSARAKSAHFLLELMYAVSREYNATAPVNKGKSASQRHKYFKENWNLQFNLGPALSGTPFYSHRPVFSALMHGKKEWTLMPPARDLYTSLHPVEWLREGGFGSASYIYAHDEPPAITWSGELRTDQPCKLVQRPGEVLFVPHRYTHQVLNLAESVGFTVEVDG